MTVIGWGSWSDEHKFETLEDMPGGTPTNVVIHPQNGTMDKIQMSWNPPEIPNGIIVRYKVKSI